MALRTVVLVFGVLLSVRASAQDLGQELQARSFNLLIEGGWRYPLSGQHHVDRSNDRFPLSYHGAVTVMAGGASGLYAAARFDGYGPSGRGAFPFGVSGRLGYFIDVHEYDLGGLRTSRSTSTDTQCRDYTSTTELCTTTRTTRTHRWWEPAGWVHGARYVFAGYRQLFNVLRHGDLDGVEDRLTNRGALSLGVGVTESKFGTFTNELELLYYLVGWNDSERSRWGLAYRGQIFLGPVFVDLNILLDAALGGELSLGLGFMLSP